MLPYEDAFPLTDTVLCAHKFMNVINGHLCVHIFAYQDSGHASGSLSSNRVSVDSLDDESLRLK